VCDTMIVRALLVISSFLACLHSANCSAPRNGMRHINKTLPRKPKRTGPINKMNIQQALQLEKRVAMEELSSDYDSASKRIASINTVLDRVQWGSPSPDVSGEGD
jgi:hypothetical protein